MGKRRKKRRKSERSFLHLLIFMFFMLIFYAVKLMPAAAYPFISRLLGLLAFHTMRSSKRLVMRNLDIAYGESMGRSEKTLICKNLFASIVLNFCETVQIVKISTEKLVGMSVIEGEENLYAAMKQARGVVGISSHMGNFPRFQAVLVKKGFPVNFFSRPPSGVYLARFFRKLFGSVSIPLIYLNDKGKAIKEAQEWISGKGILCFYVDQHSGNGVEVDFFNRKVFSPVGAATFARKYDCPVIGLFTYRLADGRHKIIIEGPYPAQRTDNPSEDIRINTAFFMTRVEHYVRECPGQWYSWMHKRFPSKLKRKK
ncbi:MAG: lysophospholipid acyltransferase family protein [Candidatus Omnitrophica bacterium]|nr:lysophospholipid acyltransferase family protein [Candidatus Omnitrophota bacterium]